MTVATAITASASARTNESRSVPFLDTFANAPTRSAANRVTIASGATAFVNSLRPSPGGSNSGGRWAATSSSMGRSSSSAAKAARTDTPPRAAKTAIASGTAPHEGRCCRLTKSIEAGGIARLTTKAARATSVGLRMIANHVAGACSALRLAPDQARSVRTCVREGINPISNSPTQIGVHSAKNENPWPTETSR
jgi:hypothetical protein